jgi:protease-4
VWTGEKAKELGLVDELGGLDAALAEAAKLGSVSATGELEIYPPSPTLRDVISSFGGVQAPMGLSADATFAALAQVDPTLAAATEHLVKLALSFQTAHVQTVAVLPAIR